MHREAVRDTPEEIYVLMAEAELQKPLNGTGNKFVTFFLGIPILSSTEGEKKIKDCILLAFVGHILLSQDN